MAHRPRSTVALVGTQVGTQVGKMVGMAVGLVVTLAAQAGPLADPTRPPTAQGGPASGGVPATGAARNASAAQAARAQAALAAAEAALALPLPLLQSVQLPTRGPAVAMIDGRLVKAGDTVDGRVVLSIDSEGLVLSGRAGNERLWLLSGSPKQAPGSITAMRTASYVPAATATQNADPGSPVRAGSNPPPPASPGPLSVAGRTQP